MRQLKYGLLYYYYRYYIFTILLFLLFLERREKGCKNTTRQLLLLPSDIFKSEIKKRRARRERLDSENSGAKNKLPDFRALYSASSCTTAPLPTFMNTDPFFIAANFLASNIAVN